MTIEELTRSIYEANCHILQLTDSLNAATRERDEARDEVQRLTAEVEMLRGVGCCESDKLDEPPSGPCGVCRKCAYRRGAEALREACVSAWDQLKSAEWETTGERLSVLLIPPEEP